MHFAKLHHNSKTVSISFYTQNLVQPGHYFPIVKHFTYIARKYHSAHTHYIIVTIRLILQSFTTTLKSIFILLKSILNDLFLLLSEKT
jgi:hypothetical protein